ncbi:MAG: Rpn family recombination-promoting nuclease/putative transposase [Gammaproteobacteria bacterium]|nr:Rpn family recombination-promoting nuclease/putative transposase [Gammaproteobacteria bacterium]
MANHDSGYHLLFAHPELVEDLVRNFVPEDWVDQLDFSRMERVNAKFHTEGLQQRDSDIIYRIHYKEGDGEIYLYLLLEFQSTPDKWMALRTLVYVGLLYQHLAKEGRLEGDKQLPPVFPLVLYNGDTPWHCAPDLRSLIALPPNSPLRKYQPQIGYYLLDESHYPDGKEGSITGALFRIENIRDINDLNDGLRLLEQQIPKTNASLKRALLTWISYVVAPHKGLKLDKRDVQNLTEVREMLSTRIKQWEQKIAEKGREEGLEKGRLLGEAKTLKKMLVLKFGGLPEWAEQRIAQADAATLDRWVERLLAANSLEDVFK